MYMTKKGASSQLYVGGARKESRISTRFQV